MPFLHLDLPLVVPGADRARLADRLARVYSREMQTNPERVAVAFRELGENGVLRTSPDGDVEAVLVVQCDIRKGRPPEQRERLGNAIAALIDEELGWAPSRTIVEFTQHDGDEFWREGGLGTDWTPSEATASRD